MRITPVYIDDIVGEWVEATSEAIITKPSTTLLDTIKTNEANALGSTMIQQIRYSKSSFNELIENLAQADKSGEERYNKYPLIHLVQDLVIDRGADIGVYGSANLNVIFMHQTEQTYKVDDRDEKVFKPVLWPMYYEFMYQIERSPWVFGSDADTGQFRHRVIKHAFWGNRQLESSKNKLNDYVDAIEIQNLNIKFKFKNC